MANTKVSALAAAGSFLTADEIPVNEAGTSKKVTGTQMATFFGYRKLDVQTTASAASLTLTVPAGTYLRLLIDFIGRSDQAGAQLLQGQFNTDVGATYYTQYSSVTNATRTENAPSITANQGIMGSCGLTGAVAGAIAAYSIEIHNADSTTLRKNWSFTGGHWNSDVAGGAVTITGQGQWNNTANAITSIKLFPAAGNLITARAILYGQL